LWCWFGMLAGWLAGFEVVFSGISEKATTKIKM
jgi:hypothetical protein